jgi:hypothetical protein
MEKQHDNPESGYQLELACEIDSEPFEAFIEGLKATSKDLPKALLLAADHPSELARAELHTAPGARQSVLRFEPSQRCLELAATLRARHAEMNVVIQADHSNPSSVHSEPRYAAP